VTATPPGWYPDNYNPALLRWWDGAGWTQHTQPAQPVTPTYPAQGTVPAFTPAAHAMPSAPTPAPAAQAQQACCRGSAEAEAAGE
jgi:hypothetical protein